MTPFFENRSAGIAKEPMYPLISIKVSSAPIWKPSL
jgi:hypothetical protein